MNYIKNIETFVHGQDELLEHDGDHDINYTATLGSLCAQGPLYNTLPVLPADAALQPLSISLVASEFASRSLKEKFFVAHAAIIGFEEYIGETHAMIGNVMVDSSLQDQDLGYKVIQTLLKLASAPKFTDLHGHVGFTALTNDACRPLMEKAKLQKVNTQNGRHHMVRTF